MIQVLTKDELKEWAKIHELATAGAKQRTKEGRDLFVTIIALFT
jgi:hypothetical protein